VELELFLVLAELRVLKVTTHHLAHCFMDMVVAVVVLALELLAQVAVAAAAGHLLAHLLLQVWRLLAVLLLL
jgi:hypothetical protein